jgi:hypothetical protein
MRRFPFQAERVTDLEEGDFWGLLMPDGRFAALQVTHLKKSGPHSRSKFVVGIVQWRGSALPTVADISGRRILAQGYWGQDHLDNAGVVVLGNSPDKELLTGLATGFETGRGDALPTEVWPGEVAGRIERAFSEAPPLRH